MSTLMNILYAQDSDRTFPVSDKVTVAEFNLQMQQNSD